MKRINLLKIATLSALGMFGSSSVFAQAPLKENIAGNLGGTRFVVTAPSAIIGVKKINYATWGSTASPAIINATVEKAYDTLGAGALINGTGPYPVLTGKFALIYRGGGTFSDKVNKCITAGAVGVIIVNNVPGDPVGMAPTPAGTTVTIPVMMVSDVDGQAISDAIKAAPSGSGIVKINIGTWNTGGTHDLGIVSRFLPLPSALNIPFSQMSGATGKVYNQHYMGGAVANYGTVTETGIVVTDSVYWTPKGSTTRTYVTKNTFSIPSISPSDSIQFGFNAPYTLAAPTSAGKYDHSYSIAYGNPDDFPQDNMYTVSQYITDSVYSKVPLNKTTGEIIYTAGYGPALGSSTDAALVGSVMFVNNNDLTNFKYMQFSVSKGSAGTLNGSSVYTHILKWTDTAGAVADSFIQSSELSPVAISAYDFKLTDSSGDIFTSRMLNIADPGNPALKLELLANTKYVLMVEVPAGFYLGYNESHSAFTRGYAQFLAGGSIPGSAIGERDEAARFTQDLNTALATGTNLFVNYPFGAVASSVPPTNNFFVDSIFYDRYNKIPAIALITTPNERVSSIVNKNKAQSIGVINAYPVPASNNITVELNLESTEKNVEIRLFDAIGRTVYTEKRVNVKSDKFDIDLTKLSSGSYHIVANTSKGLIAKSIVIVK